MERSSEKTSELRSGRNFGCGGTGVKGRDERQRTAPLTPAPPRERFSMFVWGQKDLDSADEVIHGAPAVENHPLPG